MKTILLNKKWYLCLKKETLKKVKVLISPVPQYLFGPVIEPCYLWELSYHKP